MARSAIRVGAEYLERSLAEKYSMIYHEDLKIEWDRENGPYRVLVGKTEKAWLTRKIDGKMKYRITISLSEDGEIEH